MNVSHTCRDWRNIALSSGILWSRLRIFYYGSKSNVIELLDTWLQRSHKSPLCYYIYINLKDDSKISGHATAEGIVVSMLQHQKRWKNIKLSLYKMKVSPALQKMSAVDMPMLTHLAWTFAPDGKHPRLRVDISSSGYLKKLYLVGTFELNVGNTPIQSLTERCDISIRGNPTCFADTKVCLALLQIAPNLRRFDGHFNEHEQSEAEATPADPMLVLPQMRIVYLESYDFGFPILSHLTLPGLEVLSLTTSVWAMGQLFLDFMLRSLPPLTFLEILGDGIPEEILISAIRHIPTLRELRIFDSDCYSEMFLTSLTIRGHLDVDEQLCPSLESVCLLDAHGLEGFEEQLSHMIASRWRFSETFSLVGISECGCDEELILESHGIRGYIEEGLQLHFNSDEFDYFPFNEKDDN
ncbi:hypothetical protein M0805_006454 [Coniferiporia weirii]|nr:hypothetical protein M0805_006454 [Coniferiporia weirii]